jgi:hypothetical protein
MSAHNRVKLGIVRNLNSKLEGRGGAQPLDREGILGLKEME